MVVRNAERTLSFQIETIKQSNANHYKLEKRKNQGNLKGESGLFLTLC